MTVAYFNSPYPAVNNHKLWNLRHTISLVEFEKILKLTVGEMWGSNSIHVTGEVARMKKVFHSTFFQSVPRNFHRYGAAGCDTTYYF
eukprot:TRINITY_DN6296_c0_g1_i1.p1 TRINITY_DN6296_c0_g1~~TRINITY_DN6296_c0_g1_i1.p1  ORF type:complete len:87 (+),score=6.69 TRINITY_DN6296_c0_g1_i1:129-389(+)